MKKLLLLLSILLLSFGLIGCESDQHSEKEIVSVKIECANLCKSLSNPPFTEKTFTKENQEDLRIIQQSIDNATKIPGQLDYGAMFLMRVTFQDQTQKTYVLNVDDIDEQSALLVDMAVSEQGYSVPKDLTQELRKLIYDQTSKISQ